MRSAHAINFIDSSDKFHEALLKCIREKLELGDTSDIYLDIPFEEVKQQTENSQCTVPCLDAFQQALHSWWNDGKDMESPIQVTSMIYRLDVQDFEDYISWKQEVEQLMHPFFKEAYIKLHQPNNSLPQPIRGEMTHEYWIFSLNLSPLCDHTFWAMIDKRGIRPVYNYGQE